MNSTIFILHLTALKKVSRVAHLDYVPLKPSNGGLVDLALLTLAIAL